MTQSSWHTKWTLTMGLFHLISCVYFIFIFQIWFNSIHKMFHLISFSRLYFSKRNYKDLIMKAIAYGLFISPFKKYLLSTNFVKTSWYGLILERNSYQDFFLWKYSWFTELYCFQVYSIVIQYFCVIQMVKNLPAMQETHSWSLGQEDPLERKWQRTPVFLPGEFHGQRRLVGYSPWGHKESDMTEQLTLSFSLSYSILSYFKIMAGILSAIQYILIAYGWREVLALPWLCWFCENHPSRQAAACGKTPELLPC